MSNILEKFNAGNSLTSGLIDLIQNKPISQDDFDLAAIFSLDAISNILGGACSKDAQAIFNWALSEPLNMGRKAFVLGAYASVLEMDAMHRESSVHAGIVVVPALISAAQTHNISGRKFLTALLWGSEAAFRIGRAAGPSHYKIYQNTATCGPYGSAMGVSLLLGLNNVQTVHALGNAGTQSSGLWEFRQTGAMTKQLHAGRAAESGVVAAQLAARGFTGPLKILEGNRGFFKAACPDADRNAVLRFAEGEWGLLECSIKPWPSSRHTHPVIDAALDINSQINGREIDSIEIKTYQGAIDLCNNAAPLSPHQGKSSLQYCAVIALFDGKVDLSSFDQKSYTNFLKISKKIKVTASEPFISAYPKFWGAEVEVHYTDGTKSVSAKKSVKGDPDSPLSLIELKEKARKLLKVGGIDNPDILIDLILNMANDGPFPKLKFIWE